MITSLSIAAPAYQEEEQIEPLVEGWVRFLESRFPPGAYEIVVCDDGSRDRTGERLAALAEAHPSVRPCRHAVNQGAGAALTNAIRHTTMAWVLLLDADGQYPIENFDRFAAALAEAPIAALIGYRPRKADGAFARFGSWSSGACCNWLHGTRYRDFNCAAKLIEGNLARQLHLEARGLNYSTEISSKILERGVPMREVAMLHQPRRGGRSSRSLGRASLHRILFVLYLGLRQGLLRLELLQRPPRVSP